MVFTPRGSSKRCNTRLSLLVPGVFFLLGVLAAASAADAQSWRGTETIREGVTYVANPAQPLTKQETVSPELLWKAGGDEAEEYFFGVISGITIDDDGTAYMLDRQLNEILVFSRDGEYLRSIGREGEGPGEFRRPGGIFMTTDGNIAVVQRMPGKIVVITPDGTPVGNLPVPDAPDGGFQMFADGRRAGDMMVLSTMQLQRLDDGLKEVSALVGIDGDGNKTAEFLTMSKTRNFANLEFNERDLTINSLVWEAGRNGLVYISDDFDAYRIAVYNPDGSVNRIVEREYDLRVRSKEERERNRPRVMIRQNNNTISPEVSMSETDRSVLRIYPREDGSFWVLSSHGAFDTPEGVVCTFDLFDPAGRFTRQVVVEGEGGFRDDGIEVVGDRLFVIKSLRAARRAMFSLEDGEGTGEAAAEPVSVLCYDISGVD